MKALPRHDLGLRFVGPLACLALLLYGAVSFSKPHHSYVLSFSFSGQIEGGFRAQIHLTDGAVLAPVIAQRGDQSVHLAVLPTRTIRGIHLITGKGSGIVRNMQLLKIAGPIRDLSADSLHDRGNIYRAINLDTARAIEGLRLDAVETNAVGFQTIPGAARSSFAFDLQSPLYLLRDMQLAWLQRLTVIVIIGAAALWLVSRARILPLARASPRVSRFLDGPPATVAACAVWAVAAFAVYFVYAGRIGGFSWNIIEFIIANHLQDFGRYALGAAYPTAVWRPVAPTLMVLAIDAVARDPLLTYQILSGAAMASFTASVYLLNRMLFGQLLANAGAALAFATPIVSVSLINHAHSISHLCFLLAASPTLLASVICLLRVHDGKSSAARWAWLASVGWILCYLCRPESMFMAACFFLLTVFLAARRKRALLLLPPLAVFVIVFVGFNLWAGGSTARDDVLSRKMIYQFYASQGWVDLFDAQKRSEMSTDDFELQGYVRAVALYGAPVDNAESLASAIARNPRAVADRIGNNLRQLAGLLTKGKWLSFELCLLLFALPFGFMLLKRSLRLLVLFGTAIFSVVGIFLIFHIDDRYLTIAAPAAVFLGSLGAYGLNRLPMPAAFGKNAFAAVVLVIALLHLPAHLAALSSAFERERLDLSVFRRIGAAFRDVVPAASGEATQMTVHLEIPLPPALKSNAILLLFPYFARTSLWWAQSSELYPRDRLFSLPRCAATHAVAPADASGGKYGAKLGMFFVSGAGELDVFRLAPPHKPEDAFAARFCPVRSGG
jgi:hypothetical protein